MSDKDFKTNKVFLHWLESSDEDFNTALTLFKNNSFGWALFIGHISTEKILKALFVKKYNKHAPFTHNLYRLAQKCEIDVNEEYADWLDTITTFNINARYYDYKKEFYSTCTPEFTSEWIEKIKILREWIRRKL